MAWSFAQGTSTQFGTVSTPQNIAFTSNVTAGDLLIVDIAATSTTVTYTVTDSQGNSYALIEAALLTGLAALTYYAVAKSTGACTVTIAPSGSVGLTAAITDYSGNSSTPSDSFTGNSSVSPTTSLTTTTINVSGTGEMLHAVFTQNGGVSSMTATGGFTLREAQTSGGLTPAIYVLDSFPISSSEAATGTLSIGRAYAGVGTSWLPGSPPPVDYLPWLPRPVIFEEEYEDV
jgi:hypothetical protein